jgi:hypothetical protein
MYDIKETKNHHQFQFKKLNLLINKTNKCL